MTDSTETMDGVRGQAAPPPAMVLLDEVERLDVSRESPNGELVHVKLSHRGTA